MSHIIVSNIKCNAMKAERKERASKRERERGRERRKTKGQGYERKSEGYRMEEGEREKGAHAMPKRITLTLSLSHRYTLSRAFSCHPFIFQ